MAYTTILFDIDGTLCDPGESIIESAQFALSKLGIQETDSDALRRFVGPPLEHAFQEYYQLDNVKTKQAVTFFRENLRTEDIKVYKAYAGIPELLEELSRSGKTLGIVTSKLDELAKAALKTTGLIGYFKTIGAQKPNKIVKKEVILGEVLQRLGLSRDSSVVMVGDRMHDIEAAKEHGIDSIGVLYGYGTIQELQEEGATHIAKHPGELNRLLL